MFTVPRSRRLAVYNISSLCTVFSRRETRIVPYVWLGKPQELSCCLNPSLRKTYMHACCECSGCNQQTTIIPLSFLLPPDMSRACIQAAKQLMTGLKLHAELILYARRCESCRAVYKRVSSKIHDAAAAQQLIEQEAARCNIWQLLNQSLPIYPLSGCMQPVYIQDADSCQAAHAAGTY